MFGLVKYLNAGNINAIRGLNPFMNSCTSDFYKCGNSYVLFEGFDEKEAIIHFDQESELMTLKFPVIKQLNPEFVEVGDEQISEAEFSYTFNGEDLPPDDFFHIADKQQYEKYGVPMIAKFAFDIYSGTLAKIMDNSSIEGLINSFMVVEIPEGLEDDSDDIVAAITRSKNGNMASAVNAGVKIYYVGAKGNLQEMGDRIDRNKKDFMASSGIAEAILTGQDNLDSDALVPHLLKLIMSTEDNQKLFIPLVEEIVKRFCEENGIQNIPEVDVIKSPFRVILFNKHMLQLYDRGLLPAMKATSEAGYNPEEMLHIFEQQKNRDVTKDGFGANVKLPYYGNANPDQLKNPDEKPGIKTNDNPLKDGKEKK